MSEDEKHAMKQEVVGELAESLQELFRESRKPKYRSLKERAAQMGYLAIAYMTLAGMSAGGLWVAHKWKEFTALFQTPQAIETAKAELVTQLRDAEAKNEKLYETKENHYKDTADIKQLVAEGAKDRVEIKNQLHSLSATLDDVQRTVKTRTGKQP